MKCNAIRIGRDIERIEIDFSSYEGLCESSGFKRPYTIHTQATMEVSKAAGFEVYGFCDDRGQGEGSPLACRVSGYPSLPSDLILCKADSRYNFLPLEEEELETLYRYLTELSNGGADSEDEILGRLTLWILLGDGRMIKGTFDKKRRAFSLKPEIDLGHDVSKMLRVVGITSENQIEVSYIHAGDYSPRHFFFPEGGKLTLSDHFEIDGEFVDAKIYLVSPPKNGEFEDLIPFLQEKEEDEENEIVGKSKRKAIGMRFVPFEKGERPRSQFFGPLYGTPSMVDEFDDTVMFLGMIALEEIAPFDKENKLPHEGYLYFFLDAADSCYHFEPIVRYVKEEPTAVIDDFNDAFALGGFPGLARARGIEFFEVEEDEDCCKLLGVPCDWNYEEEPGSLLLTLSHFDEDLDFLPQLDGYTYIFFGPEDDPFGGASIFQEYS